MAACRNGKPKAGALEKGPAKPKPAHFTARPAADQSAISPQVKDALGKTQIAGCAQRQPLSPATKKNRAPACKSGHMPGAVNLH